MTNSQYLPLKKVTALSKELADNNNSFEKCDIILDRGLANKIGELTLRDDLMLEPFAHAFKTILPRLVQNESEDSNTRNQLADQSAMSFEKTQILN